MQIATLRQLHPLTTLQVIHQALVLDIAMRVRTQGDMTVQKTSLRQGGVGVEEGGVSRDRVCGNPSGHGGEGRAVSKVAEDASAKVRVSRGVPIEGGGGGGSRRL